MLYRRRFCSHRFRVIRGHALVLLMALAIGGVTAEAQVSVNPSTVTFACSPDHDATTEDGIPVVLSYVLEFYSAGSAQPALVLSLGKPQPAADGTVRVVLGDVLGAWYAPGVRLRARVVAVGPGGRASSEPSNEFAFDSRPSPPGPTPDHPLVVWVANLWDGIRLGLSSAMPIVARAATLSGSITQVTFYVDGKPVDSAASAPYRGRWRAVVGNHVIVAVAADSAGRVISSVPVTVTVLRTPARVPPLPEPGKPTKARIKK